MWLLGLALGALQFITGFTFTVHFTIFDGQNYQWTKVRSVLNTWNASQSLCSQLLLVVILSAMRSRGACPRVS